MQRVGEHKIVAAYECNDIERPHFSSRNGGVFDCGRQSVCSGVDTYEEYFGRHSTCKKTDSLQCRLFWLGSHFHLATCVKRDGKPRTRASDRSLSHRNMLTLPVSIICVKYLLHSSGKKRVHFIHQVEKLGWYEYYDCMHPFHNWMRGRIDNASVPIAPSASGWHISIKEPTRIHCDASFSNFEWWKEKNRLERYSTKVTMHFTATCKHEWKLNFSTTAQVKGEQCQQHAHKHDMLQPLKCTYMNEVFPQNRSSRLLRKLRKARTVRLVLPLYPAELTVGYFAAYSLSTSVASASVVEIR